MAKLTLCSPQVSSSLFFQYNAALRPPYNVLVDTNFLSHTVQRKLDLLESMMSCLYATCRPIITSCVMAELEKLGPKYRIALRIARDERWERLECDHKGVYADDCIVDRIQRHKIYIVATNDRDLKRRIRKVPGVPIMSVARGEQWNITIVSKATLTIIKIGKYVIERLPDAPEK
jgi:U3 small nucleolar RNA-associated protein 24